MSRSCTEFRSYWRRKIDYKQKVYFMGETLEFERFEPYEQTQGGRVWFSGGWRGIVSYQTIVWLFNSDCVPFYTNDWGRSPTTNRHIYKNWFSDHLGTFKDWARRHPIENCVRAAVNDIGYFDIQQYKFPKEHIDLEPGEVHLWPVGIANRQTAASIFDVDTTERPFRFLVLRYPDYVKALPVYDTSYAKVMNPFEINTERFPSKEALLYHIKTMTPLAGRSARLGNIKAKFLTKEDFK